MTTNIASSRSSAIETNNLFASAAVNDRRLIPVAGGDREVDVGHVDVAQFELEDVSLMAEAALALCTGEPQVLTGRVAYSQPLLAELGIAVPES